MWLFVREPFALDWNLICVSPGFISDILIRKAVAMKRLSQLFPCCFEGNDSHKWILFRQCSCGCIALGIFDRIKWLTQKRNHCRLWNNPPHIYFIHIRFLPLPGFFPPSRPPKLIEVKWESIFRGWFSDGATLRFELHKTHVWCHKPQASLFRWAWMFQGNVLEEGNVF